MKTYTREDVVKIIDEILKYPDVIIDAITNEYTDFDGDRLLSMIEN